MILSDREWTTLTWILENRSYRYDDEEDYGEKYKVWKNLSDRIRSSKTGSIQRYNKEQKAYLLDLLDEYLNYSDPNDEETEDINRMMKALSK